jgi:uncharacterized integral membrane protein
MEISYLDIVNVIIVCGDIIFSICVKLLEIISKSSCDVKNYSSLHYMISSMKFPLIVAFIKAFLGWNILSL